MRHKYSGRKLNRTSSHRAAMFKNMMASLIEHEEIKTTLPKAKELRGFVERLITISKNDTVAKRRIVFSRIRSKEAVLKLFEELNREGTTIIFATHSQEIIKLGNHRIINLNRGKVDTVWGFFYGNII